MYRKLLLIIAAVLVLCVVGGTLYYLHLHPAGEKKEQHFDKLEWGLMRSLERRFSGDVGRDYKDSPHRYKSQVDKNNSRKSTSTTDESSGSSSSVTAIVKKAINPESQPSNAASTKTRVMQRKIESSGKMHSKVGASQQKITSKQSKDNISKHLSPQHSLQLKSYQAGLPNSVQHILGLLVVKGERMVVSRSSGQVIDISVRLRDQVKPGQALLVFDNKIYYGNLLAARNKLQQLKVELSALKGQVGVAAKQAAIKKKIALAQAQVLSNQAYLDALSHLSPIAGNVSKIGVKVGQWVQPGTVLFKISPNHAMQWVALLPLDWAQAMHVGQKISLRNPALNGTKHTSILIHARVVEKIPLQKKEQSWVLVKANLLGDQDKLQEDQYLEVVLDASDLR